jgi:hypothetical protein
MQQRVPRNLAQLWRLANNPDNNLGQDQVGPSPQKITQACAIKVLREMGVDDKSHFLDLGSGHGLVCFAALMEFDVAVSIGIEQAMERTVWGAGTRDLMKLSPDRLELLTRDITDDNTDVLKDITHIYSFDFDFPEKTVCKAVATIVYNQSNTLKVFASAHDLVEWRAIAPLAHMHFWDHNVTQREQKVRVKLCGSGARHTIYLMDIRS